MKSLTIGAVHSIPIDPKLPCIRTGLRVQHEAWYTTTIEVIEAWKDWFVPASPSTGWLGIYRVLEPLIRRGARTTHYPMYSLVGGIDNDDATLFMLATSVPWQPSRDGELTCFANDYVSGYCNNRGRLNLSITRGG